MLWLAISTICMHHIMSSILRECKSVTVYIDDVGVFRKSAEEHRNLEATLQHISEAGMKLNNKWVSNVKEFKFLGHRIAPLLDKVDAIAQVSIPEYAVQLR